MAELLVKAISASHMDPLKDLTCYKAGDPVVVQPDGHVWGAEEGLPRFWIIKVPSVTVAQALAYLERSPDRTDRLRRLWRLNVSSLPGNVRNQLQNTGTITVTPAQIAGYMERKP